MENWTPPMRRYEIRTRIQPVARVYVDTLPFDAPVVVADIIAMTDLDGFTPEDIDPSVETVLNDMCGEDGSLIRTEEGWVKKSAAEIGEIMDTLTIQHHKDNREWYVSCVLMAVIGVLWAISHLWGADLGMREFPMTLFGIPMTMYDTILIDGLALMAAYWIFGRISNPV